jgi:hypothetical protein
MSREEVMPAVPNRGQDEPDLVDCFIASKEANNYS